MSTLKHRNASLVAARSRRNHAARMARSAAAAVHEERRQAVYEAAVGTAPEDTSNTLPPRGPARDAVADRVRDLKERLGATHLQAAVALNLEVGQISLLCREYGIRSIRRNGATRTKGYAPLPGGDRDPQ